MMMALKDKPDVPFRVPANIKLISVDPKTGLRSNAPGSILEAFKPGTAPPDYVACQIDCPPPEAGNANTDQTVGTGTGGVY